MALLICARCGGQHELSEALQRDMIRFDKNILREEARVIRNIERAIERNENREINMGEAWALIKEAVAESKLTK